MNCIITCGVHVELIHSCTCSYVVLTKPQSLFAGNKAKTDRYCLVVNDFINARKALVVKIKRIILPNQRLINQLCLYFGF